MQLGSGDEAAMLPDVVEQFEGDEERAWRAFELLEATSDENGHWRFLPTQVLDEPEALLNDVMLLRSIKYRMQKQQSGE